MIKLNYREREYFNEKLHKFIEENMEFHNLTGDEVIELIDDYICYKITKI